MTYSSPTQTSVVVAPDQGGERLDRLLARHVADLSRSRVKALIEAGSVEVDGHTIRDPSYRVNSGALIKADVPAPQPAWVAAAKGHSSWPWPVTGVCLPSPDMSMPDISMPDISI